MNNLAIRKLLQNPQLKKNAKLGTIISLCSLYSQQTVMQKDNIEALHQNRDPLIYI